MKQILNLFFTLTCLSPLQIAMAQDKDMDKDKDKENTYYESKPSKNKDEASTIVARPIVIFGDSTDQVDRGFTGQTINEKKFEIYQYTDVNRALKQVRGVYVREEDGLGLRPNIGMRGTNPDRSKKIVFLEDDVLIGPAPFSAPAAYFTPNMNHVESIDVYKGFSATHIGPNSVGGALNYITPRILERRKINSSQVTYGSFNTVNAKLSSSGALPYGSYLVEGSHISSDGFKTIDGGGDAGLTKSEVLGKLKWDISKGDRTQNIEFRLGLSYEDSNETYLGLARQDFDQNPYRRYSSSALDNMNWDHQKFQIRHNLQLSETALLETVAYRHNYNRTWARMDKFFGGNAANSFTNVLNNPSSQPAFYNILIGAADSASQGSGGQLELASNKREFFSQGVQSKYTDEFSLNLKSGVVKIEPEVFIRAHQDQIIRDQVAEIYEMETGQLFTTGLQRQNNLEEQTTTALTFSSRANITYKSYIVTPVIRMESVDYDFRDDIDPARNASRTDLAFIPGISLFKRLTPNMSVGTSYNKAASLAGLSNSGDEIRETADNYELLFKYLNQDLLLQADATAFYTNYQNITGTCTVSTGCLSGSGEAFNGGAADIMGFEAGATKGFFAGPVYVPFGLNLTYLDATFSSDFASSSPEWGQGNVQSGDPLPYIPELQYTVSLGAEYKNFGTELFYTYQSKVFDQSVQAGRVTIDDFSFIDLGGFYNLNEALKINYRISNLFDKDYAVAARPFGLRPGQPRALQVGFKYTF